MTRNIHLRHNFNKTIASILHNFASILLCIKTTVVLTIRFCLIPTQYLTFAPSAYFCQFGVFFYFNTPTLVLSQVPVETVKFVGSHHIEQLFNFFLAIEVTTFVEHKATPFKSWRIFHIHSLYRPSFSSLVSSSCQNIARGKHLLQSLQGIEETCRTCSLHHNALGCYIQAISFRTKFAVQF